MKSCKLICLIIIFLYMTNCSSSTKSNSLNEYEFKYTTASVLIARKSSSLNGEIALQIPYGTIVNVKKTDVKSKYNDKESNWYYSKEIDAYIFGLFLSDTQPTENINYTIYRNDNNESCPGDTSTIIMNNMKTKKIHEEDCHGDLSKSEIEGTYKVYQNYIEITWSDYFTINSSVYNKKVSKNLKKGYIEKLFWNSKAKGWLSEDIFKEINKHDCVYLNDECRIDCSESCQTLNNKKGCKTYNDPMDIDMEKYSVYCTKRR